MERIRMDNHQPTQQAMKVLLVDDHPLVLSALQSARATLKADSDFDLVLLDLGLGDADGFDVLEEFRSTYPAVPVVVVSASDRTSDVIRAIDSGAMGFVPKKSSHHDLYEALRLVMTGAMYVPRSMLGLAFGSYASGAAQRGDADTVPGVMHMADGTPLGPNAKAEPHQKVPSFQDLGMTPRQAEVLSLLLQGLPNKLIARQLNLSVETVKDHVAAVLRALGVSSRTQAVLAVSQMHQGPGGFVARTPPQR
jgi:DNA-binding NarL/FixJ family response regulator